jgi:glutamyl-tRNA reductase
VIVAVGLSHKTAPIEVRERLAIAQAALPDLLGKLVLQPAVGEAVVLSTCNRVEVYAAPRRGSSLEAASGAVVSVLAGIGGDAVAPHLGTCSAWRRRSTRSWWGSRRSWVS